MICAPVPSLPLFIVAVSPTAIVPSPKIGHEPQIRVLRKVHGKSVAETLSSPTAFRKAQGEVSEFHRFQELSAELVTINEKICRLRPLEQEPGGWTAEKKTAAAIHREVARGIDALLRVIFTARHKTGVMDLEAVEMALQAALQQADAAGLSQLLRQESPAKSQGPGTLTRGKFAHTRCRRMMFRASIRKVGVSSRHDQSQRE